MENNKYPTFTLLDRWKLQLRDKTESDKMKKKEKRKYPRYPVTVILDKFYSIRKRVMHQGEGDLKNISAGVMSELKKIKNGKIKDTKEEDYFTRVIENSLPGIEMEEENDKV